MQILWFLSHIVIARLTIASAAHMLTFVTLSSCDSTTSARTTRTHTGLTVSTQHQVGRALAHPLNPRNIHTGLIAAPWSEQQMAPHHLLSVMCQPHESWFFYTARGQVLNIHFLGESARNFSYTIRHVDEYSQPCASSVA